MNQHAPSRRPIRKRIRRAFSMIEMLIALSISASIMAATLVAFDAMFKVYQTATDSASNHVVARIAVNRLLGMIRTGSEFGPFPNDVLDSEANPLKSDYFEFASRFNADRSIAEVTRVEFRYPGQPPLLRTWGAADDPPALPSGVDGSIPGELWLVLIDVASSVEQEFLMLTEVRSVEFTLRYTVGPKLVKGTIDITFEPSLAMDDGVWTPATPETVRLVASAMPRRSVE
jgi:prepilin-type N-terminal cleavage/methylation domain-containing protein